MKQLIAYGGGMDSACLLDHATYGYPLGPKNSFKNPNVACVIFNYGQKAWEGERASARYFCDYYGVQLYEKKLPLVEGSPNPLQKGSGSSTKHNDYVLPLRNLILISHASALAAQLKFDEVLVGFHIEPSKSKFADAKATFALSMRDAVQDAGGPTLRFPFITQERHEFIFTHAMRNKHILTKSFSCYESHTTKECGKCTKCLIKAKIIAKVNAKAKSIK